MKLQILLEPQLLGGVLSHVSTSEC
jgi:hypothetical protein